MKFTSIIIVFSLIIAISLPACALQGTGSITVSVLVQGNFGLMVNSDSFDFANLLPGQTGEMTRAEGISVAGTSSSGNPWYLAVSATRPLSSGSDFIPSENFTWYGSTEGNGIWTGNKEKNFEQQNTAYVSSFDESNLSAKVVNNFKFKLRVPEDTKSGSYTTTVLFTMTE